MDLLEVQSVCLRASCYVTVSKSHREREKPFACRCAQLGDRPHFAAQVLCLHFARSAGQRRPRSEHCASKRASVSGARLAVTPTRPRERATERARSEAQTAASAHSILCEPASEQYRRLFGI